MDVEGSERPSHADICQKPSAGQDIPRNDPLKTERRKIQFEALEESLIKNFGGYGQFDVCEHISPILAAAN